MHLDDAFSDDEIEKNILNILLSGSLRDSLQYKMESQAAFTQLVSWTGNVSILTMIRGSKGEIRWK